MNGSKIIEAIKLIYPEIKGGFVYWGTNYDGSAFNHPSEGLKWENKEFSKPEWSKIEEKLKEIEAE